ncbi:MAG: inorganic diphosphatase [Hymenobacter sp.]|nr:inorganic diphosphatase [Hymenobacter sp.]
MRLFAGFVVVLLSGGLAGCRPRYEELATFSAERKLLQVVVEMPAGTNHARRYDPTTHDFVPVRRAGLDLVVEFLPCPGNLGFVPGTRLGAASGPLPALVLTETQPAGTVLEVVPVGLLTLDDNGTLLPIVLAVPARPGQQILPGIVTWQALTSRYPSAQEVVRQWFLHQGRPGEIRIVSWKDEKAAEQQVEAAMN